MKQDKKSKFIRVRCNKCKNEQIIFEKASTKVKCLKCGEEITESSSGKAKLKANIIEVLS
jgi:small subunit ribosomal protein S27e